jgi:hypothetical protein
MYPNLPLNAKMLMQEGTPISSEMDGGGALRSRSRQPIDYE